MTRYASQSTLEAECSSCGKHVVHNESLIDEDAGIGSLLFGGKKVATFQLFTGFLACLACKGT